MVVAADDFPKDNNENSTATVTAVLALTNRNVSYDVSIGMMIIQRSNEEEKTVDMAMVTVSRTSTVAEANSEGNATVTIVPETIKPASGAPGIAGIRTFFRKKNRTKVAVAANERLLGEIIYTYWDDYGQFGNNNPRKTSPYSTQAYTGAKEYKSFATPHQEDCNKRKNILLDRVEEFAKLF